MDIAKPAVRGVDVALKVKAWRVGVVEEAKFGALGISLDGKSALLGANGIEGTGGVEPPNLAFAGT